MTEFTKEPYDAGFDRGVEVGFEAGRRAQFLQDRDWFGNALNCTEQEALMGYWVQDCCPPSAKSTLNRV